jgi:hypothetical protein
MILALLVADGARVQQDEREIDGYSISLAARSFKKKEQNSRDKDK